MLHHMTFALCHEHQQLDIACELGLRMSTIRSRVWLGLVRGLLEVEVVADIPIPEYLSRGWHTDESMRALEKARPRQTAASRRRYGVSPYLALPGYGTAYIHIETYDNIIILALLYTELSVIISCMA